MLTAQSRQKIYADERRKDIEFDVGDMVFLKVAPMEGVLRFEKKGKLSPRFVGPFEILERIGHVAYRLTLPPSFSAVHDVFHVSILRRYVADPTHVVDFEPLQINEDLSYEEQPVEILAREVKMLCHRGISLVKVLWRNHRVEEATWEREEDMRAQYPELRKWTTTVRQSREPDPHARVPSSVVCPNPSSSTPVHQTLPRSSSTIEVRHHLVSVVSSKDRAPSSQPSLEPETRPARPRLFTVSSRSNRILAPRPESCPHDPRLRCWESVTLRLGLVGQISNPIVLGVPLGITKDQFVPTEAQIVRVRGRASSVIPLFRTLIGSRGRGKNKGKLASDPK
ncbi:pol protein [Cucumis melo var. makuwa]|uniref:Pol protein n=1 Tax=Cucumis melo var. makuwa TaxID=1194695 RepID=A0A5D3DRN8_CUCMM|nr:pol protein [Cucumis melo var. makuwa]TYK26276.1 pol protein [Cucumis melo var. makuwa]